MISYRERFLEDLDLLDRAANTKKSYLSTLKRFFSEGYPNKNPAQITEEDVRAYFLYLKRDSKSGPSSIKSAKAALKFFLK